MMLYECGIRYERTMENGMNKKVTELYLVDACSFAEAEGRITNEMEPFISGDFDVVTIKRTNYSEIVENGAGITKGLPVLKLCAVRSATSTGVKVPKPRIITTSPLASASLITLSVPSMAFTVVAVSYTHLTLPTT